MCGRFALVASGDEIKSRFKLNDVPEGRARYNIAPGQSILMLTTRPDTSTACIEWMRWGLIPFYAKEAGSSSPLINARAETLAVKPAFRNSFKHKRGLVIMSGYFEWRTLKTHKQPYYISPKDASLLAVAALWECWQSQDGDVVHSCCMITTDASKELSRYHHRMPVLLTPEQQAIWLKSEDADSSRLSSLLTPSVSIQLTVVPVTPKMNNWRYTASDSIRALQ